jgi:hypothetical protein
MLDFNPYNRRTEYKTTKNPLLAWDMILDCCKEKKTFPDWVMDYLEDVAEELVNLSPSKKRVPEEIRDALGFKGKPFEKYRRFLNRSGKADFYFKWSVYHWIEDRLLLGIQKKVFEAAGKHFYGEDNDTFNHRSMVEKDYREMKRIIEEVETENREITNE